MRVRDFFFVCLGLFLLAGAYSLGGRKAYADWDNDAPGRLVGCDIGEMCFTSNGEAWRLEANQTWTRHAYRDLPVATSDIKLLISMDRFITNDDVAWYYDGDGQRWVMGPRFPGTIQVDDQGWSHVKRRYRG